MFLLYECIMTITRYSYLPDFGIVSFKYNTCNNKYVREAAAANIEKS